MENSAYQDKYISFVNKASTNNNSDQTPINESFCDVQNFERPESANSNNLDKIDATNNADENDEMSETDTIKGRYDEKSRTSNSYYNAKKNNLNGKSVKKTWKQTGTFKNHRVEPYRRYNNSNHRNNFNRQNNHQSDYRSHYYNYNQHFEQRYDTYQNRYNINFGLYTRSFKERLFRGFLNFIDFVFHHNKQ